MFKDAKWWYERIFDPTANDRELGWKRPWVRFLYVDLLNREPEKAGFDYWLTQVNRGVSPELIADAFVHSREYCTIITNFLYLYFLGREAEPAGLDYWRDVLMGGKSLQDVILGFCDSPEYKSTNPPNDGFVESLYNKLLGRHSDPEGFKFWVNVLKSGQKTTSDVIHDFLISQEYSVLRAEEFYNKFLGRKSDPEGLKYWSQKIQNGMSLQEITRGFVISEEYKSRNVNARPLTPDHSWRYIEFRDQVIQKLKQILSDESAIQLYKNDPFNPHAIARLRLSAYQKAVVMKYIDNLIDWGDYLFAQDSIESINEATMLYVFASDILGKRPVELGRCKTSDEDELIYDDKIGRAIDKGSEFLITLENWCYTNTIASAIGKYNIAKFQISSAVNEEMVLSTTYRSSGDNKSDNLSYLASLTGGANFSDIDTKYSILDYDKVVRARKHTNDVINSWTDNNDNQVKKYFGPPVVRQYCTLPVFCVPPNKDLLEYWDRVENRLFKIHNCMNISGIQRQLPLFQPPINPMLLVRAKAAGLSLEDIILGDKQLPPYRFTYLIEKAKQFTQVVQNFGSALLNALKEKDVEELTLLRSLHERNILVMTTEVKKQQVDEAKHQYNSLVETKTHVQNRIIYYQELISKGLIAEENTEQELKSTSRSKTWAANDWEIISSFSYLIPQTGSPVAMTYGGRELGAFASAVARGMHTDSSINESKSSSSAVEASFKRREQDWVQQLKLAQQEIKQIEQQLLAAEIRKSIDEKDQEIHVKNIEQSIELDEFYKNKFTNLGMYDFLSVNLNRLYREAYSVAFEMAKMAEKTYQFECDDDTTFFVANDNWQFDRAGLLAGERLLLQLHRLEKAYIEKNKRDYEITQSFSLALLNPSELVMLKETGTCRFVIEEIMFDLLYPGHYKRLIKSVRITIPCVTGPYTNIGAKLILEGSKVRKEAKIDSRLMDIANQKLTSIATSNAQNDGGIFDLNFRDERYLAFEGAGAISQWKLELPSMLRSFDYDTIADVIVHVSYTAKEDGGFRKVVEGKIKENLEKFASNPDQGLYRLISLKHEFPNAFYKLLHPLYPEAEQKTDFQLEKNYFPYFLAEKKLALSYVKVYLNPRDNDPVGTTDLVININNTDISKSAWVILRDSNGNDTSIMEANVSLSGDPIKKWTINAGANGFDKEELDDILILLRYSAS